jgi:hypothetical protein
MHISETTHSWRAAGEPLEAVISIGFSRSYKREFIRELKSIRQIGVAIQS